MVAGLGGTGEPGDSVARGGSWRCGAGDPTATVVEGRPPWPLVSWLSRGLVARGSERPGSGERGDPAAVGAQAAEAAHPGVAV